MNHNRDRLSAELAGDALTIGKAEDCDLVITDDDYASRRHACIHRSGCRLTLEDLNSSNGTFLRVRRPIVLEIGDEIVIGSTVLRLEEASSQGA